MGVVFVISVQIRVLSYRAIENNRSFEFGGDSVVNPWEEISLSDYENHMSLDSVKQLQAMNEMMKKQFVSYSVSTAMVLGVAGGQR